MQSLHVYTTSTDLWIDCYLWGAYLDRVAEQAPDLRYLKMTLGHVEGLAMEIPTLPKPNSRQGVVSDPKNQDNEIGWGWHLRKLKRLTQLELETETVTERMEELDEVVAEAKNWRITVTSDKHLVLNPQKTKREGWHGPVLTEPRYVYAPSNLPSSHFATSYSRVLAPPPNAIESEKKLINAGVSLVRSRDSKDQASKNRLTFYSVTLVFEAKKINRQDLETS